MRVDRVLLAAGVAALGLGTVLANPALAGATFPGSQNGNVDFIAICDGNIGQATYSLNPNGIGLGQRPRVGLALEGAVTVKHELGEDVIGRR